MSRDLSSYLSATTPILLKSCSTQLALGNTRVHLLGYGRANFSTIQVIHDRHATSRSLCWWIALNYFNIAARGTLLLGVARGRGVLHEPCVQLFVPTERLLLSWNCSRRFHDAAISCGSRVYSSFLRLPVFIHQIIRDPVNCTLIK